MSLSHRRHPQLLSIVILRRYHNFVWREGWAERGLTPIRLHPLFGAINNKNSQ